MICDDRVDVMAISCSLAGLEHRYDNGDGGGGGTTTAPSDWIHCDVPVLLYQGYKKAAGQEL